EIGPKFARTRGRRQSDASAYRRSAEPPEARNTLRARGSGENRIFQAATTAPASVSAAGKPRRDSAKQRSPGRNRYGTQLTMWQSLPFFEHWYRARYLARSGLSLRPQPEPPYPRARQYQADASDDMVARMTALNVIAASIFKVTPISYPASLVRISPILQIEILSTIVHLPTRVAGTPFRGVSGVRFEAEGNLL